MMSFRHSNPGSIVGWLTSNSVNKQFGFGIVNGLKANSSGEIAKMIL